MTRSMRLVPGSLALTLALTACSTDPPVPPAPFSVVEASIAEMQAAMQEGRVTSRELVQQYLTRIAYYDGTLNATMAVNRHALEEADRLDGERRDGRVRGPLHGIPIALKDIINTTDMPTTGGALAFEGYTPPYDATLVTLLREAGAVLIAKTVNTELANWVTNGMPGNYSAVGGYGLNPYDPRRDPRPDTSDGRPVLGTGGSSSGIGYGGQLLGRQRRHRNVGVDSEPVEPEHAGRHQAHGWAHQPLRHHPDHRRPGHGRADGEPSPTPPSCWVPWKAPRPIRTTRPPPLPGRRPTATTRRT
jgi:hypothetical protein